MSGETFRDSTVVALLNEHFNPCKINIDADSTVAHFDSTLTCLQLVQFYQVTGIPDMLILNGQADTLGRIRGYITAARLGSILDSIINTN